MTYEIKPVANWKEGEALGYLYGRLVDDTLASHLIIVYGPDKTGPELEVKRVVASCTSIEAATAAGRLLSGKAGREW